MPIFYRIRHINLYILCFISFDFSYFAFMFGSIRSFVRSFRQSFARLFKCILCNFSQLERIGHKHSSNGDGGIQFTKALKYPLTKYIAYICAKPLILRINAICRIHLAIHCVYTLYQMFQFVCMCVCILYSIHYTCIRVVFFLFFFISNNYNGRSTITWTHQWT